MTDVTTSAQISGAAATEIADSVRQLVERGTLSPGAALPPVRALADDLSPPVRGRAPAPSAVSS